MSDVKTRELEPQNWTFWSQNLWKACSRETRKTTNPCDNHLWSPLRLNALCGVFRIPYENIWDIQYMANAQNINGACWETNGILQPRLHKKYVFNLFIVWQRFFKWCLFWKCATLSQFYGGVTGDSTTDLLTVRLWDVLCHNFHKNNLGHSQTKSYLVCGRDNNVFHEFHASTVCHQYIVLWLV